MKFVEHADVPQALCRSALLAAKILRFGLFLQLDALGEVAALEIEDAVAAPAVLVIADERGALIVALSVVPLVPDRPKKIVVSPAGPTSAEQ